MAYQKILVAMDRSERNGVLLETAIELAKQNSAALLIFHCLPIEDTETYNYSDLYGANLINFSKVMQEQLERETEENRRWLEGCRQQAQEAGINADWTWRVSSAGRGICKMAKQWEADLIVLGRRGQGAISEIILGSVSNYVLHHAPCSVLVVQ